MFSAQQKGYRVAVVGATGNVGQEVLSILHERRFPVKEVIALASEESLGKKLSFGEDKTVQVTSLKSFDFAGIDLVFSAATSGLSKRIVPTALQAGAIVVDKTSCFRMEKNVPLVVPEVNGDLLKSNPSLSLFANPNCVVIPLVLALWPLHLEAGLKRVVVSTYQSVSGAGKEAMDELYTQTRASLMNSPLQKNCFSKQIIFNLIPQIGDINLKGWSEEEEKIMEETQKIMGFEVPISVTCVRVPVFVGHSLAVFAEFEKELPVGTARHLLEQAPGIEVTRSQDGGYVTPVECVGEDAAFVSRLRRDKSVPHGLAFWITCDNLRKGAALNAVQIAEALVSTK